MYLQPHAAFSAVTHGLMSKWTYLSRTTPDIGPLLKPIDNALSSDLPALTGRPPPNDLQCTLFALPARLGGLGIDIPSRTAAYKIASSLLVTSTLCDHILSQLTMAPPLFRSSWNPRDKFINKIKQIALLKRIGSRRPCRTH